MELLFFIVEAKTDITKIRSGHEGNKMLVGERL
jgi:hypothetical protein